jgi:hypothetical protein
MLLRDFGPCIFTVRPVVYYNVTATSYCQQEVRGSPRSAEIFSPYESSIAP